jgi:hypothetical protein
MAGGRSVSSLRVSVWTVFSRLGLGWHGREVGLCYHAFDVAELTYQDDDVPTPSHV